MWRRRLSRSGLFTIATVVVAILTTFAFFSHIQVTPAVNLDRLTPTATARKTTQDLKLEYEAMMAEEKLRITPVERQQDIKAKNEAPYQAKVGIYATNNYDVELEVPKYSGKGYLWLKWNTDLQKYLDERGLNIQSVITPINLLGSSASDQPLEPLGNKPETLPDGRFWQVFAYHGDFYIDQLNFKRFPFNTLSLPIAIEADDPDGSLSYAGLRIEPDIKSSGFGNYTNVNGYINLGFTAAEYKHHYNTDFGSGDVNSSDYSQVVYRVMYGTSAWAAFWSLLQPLVIVMIMIVVMTRIQHDIWDVRVGIPVTVLLALVFMQESYRGNLPALPYLSFLDKVYVVAYIITLIAFITSVANGRVLHATKEANDPDRIKLVMGRMEQFDRIWPPTVLATLFVLVAACWFI